MKINVYFSETQRFIRDWIPMFLLMLGCTCLFLYGVIKQVIFGFSFGTKPASNTALIFCLVFCLLFTLPFFCIKLETRIKEDGVYVKYFPFHLAYKRYVWAEISKLYVKQYTPILSFGVLGILENWGIWRSRYIVSGTMGLQLEFISGRRLLIGTNKPKELTEILNSIEKLEK